MDIYYSTEIASFKDCFGIELTGVEAHTEMTPAYPYAERSHLIPETYYHADAFRIEGNGFAVSGKLGLCFKDECNGFEDIHADDVKCCIRRVCGQINYELLEETADLTPAPPQIPATFKNVAATLTSLGLPVSVRRN